MQRLDVHVFEISSTHCEVFAGRGNKKRGEDSDQKLGKRRF